MTNNSQILARINKFVFKSHQIDSDIYTHVSDHIQYCQGFFDLEVGDNTISDYFIIMEPKYQVIELGYNV